MVNNSRWFTAFRVGAGALYSIVLNSLVANNIIKGLHHECFAGDASVTFFLKEHDEHSGLSVYNKDKVC